MKSRFLSLIKAWDEFWFAPKDLYMVSLVRMCLGVTMFTMYSLRLINFEWFYSESGIFPLSMRHMIMPEIMRPLFEVFIRDETAAFWGHILFVVLLFLFALGLVGRIGTFALFLLHIGFMQRNYTIVYGADLFNAFWLLYLSLVQHNRCFSVLNLFSKTKRSISGDLLSTVGIRLFQIQLCVSYAYTGIEKLKGSQWWEGTAVWYVLGMKELLIGDFSFLQSFPLIIGAMTIITVVFEVYFPMAMLYKPIRKYWLLIGLAFHLGTAIFMSLPFFCAVMIAPYLLFLTKDDILPVLRKLKIES